MTVIHVDFGNKKKKDIVVNSNKKMTVDDYYNMILSRSDSRVEEGIINSLLTSKVGGPWYGEDIHNIIAFRDYSLLRELRCPLPSKYIEPLRDEDGRILLGLDMLVGGADPFLWLDVKYGFTKDFLEKYHNEPMQICTRSDLIAHDEYIASLNKKKHHINIHIQTLNSRFSRLLEPGAASTSRRIKAINKLAEEGFVVRLIYERLTNPKLPEFFSSGQSRDITDLMNNNSIHKDVHIVVYDTVIRDYNTTMIIKMIGES